MRILATRVDAIRLEELGDKLRLFLEDPRPHVVVTANPEIVLQAHRDSAYRIILNVADLVVVDGFGLALAARVWGGGVGRITGVDVLGALCRLARERRLGMWFELWPGGLSTISDVRRALPGLDVQSPDPTIVICNYGAPEQEFWLRENSGRFPNARILVGVGGAVDYLTGRVRRAPAMVRRLGLEWLWRLFRQPRRIRRIWNAVVVFPLTVMVRQAHHDK